MLQINTILAPIDFGPKAEAAAEHAAVLARDFRARLILLHVFEPVPHEYLDLTPQGQAAQRIAAENEREAMVRRLRELARKIDPDRPAEVETREGGAAHRIIEAAEEHKADLIVLPTHSGGRFRRFLLGSTTLKVIHDAGVPVLTGVHIEELPPFGAHPYRRIAVLLDVLEHEDDARTLDFAADLADASKAELVALHTPPGVRVAAAEWLPEETKKLLVAAGSERVAKLLAERGVEAEIVIGRQSLAPFVEETMRDRACDVLVIPRRDAQSLIRRSPAPTYSI